ncbi:MAG: hypothetical protein HQK60_01705 [Deltaproteobacteria bacterium]|nr:hypothetical protein [Deltaproteobacteria bacterium]
MPGIENNVSSLFVQALDAAKQEDWAGCRFALETLFELHPELAHMDFKDADRETAFTWFTMLHGTDLGNSPDGSTARTVFRHVTNRVVQLMPAEGRTMMYKKMKELFPEIFTRGIIGYDEHDRPIIDLKAAAEIFGISENEINTMLEEKGGGVVDPDKIHKVH